MTLFVENERKGDGSHGTEERASPFPLWNLLSLMSAGFLTILTEALPAGLLPQMGASLKVSTAVAGQVVTVYAIGSLLAAVPLATATQRMRRKPLLLATVTAFAITNSITAVSTNIVGTLLFRFIAGVAAGLLWAMLAGYATRLVAMHQHGRAITIALAGTPLALSVGIPAGTYLGLHLGWRYAFGVMSVCSVLVALWMLWRMPDFPGQEAVTKVSPVQALRHPGVGAVLAATFAFVLAHNSLYTYIAPFLASVGMASSVNAVLLVFGIAGLAGVLLVGALIDRNLRVSMLVAAGSFAVSSLALCLWGHHPAVTYAAIAVWGFAFAGAGTIVTAASARAAGPLTDLAQSLLVTDWNLAITGGGVLGGLLIGAGQLRLLPWIMLVLLLTSFVIVVLGRTGFAARAPELPIHRGA